MPYRVRSENSSARRDLRSTNMDRTVCCSDFASRGPRIQCATIAWRRAPRLARSSSLLTGSGSADCRRRLSTSSIWDVAGDGRWRIGSGAERFGRGGSYRSTPSLDGKRTNPAESIDKWNPIVHYIQFIYIRFHRIPVPFWFFACCHLATGLKDG